MMRVCGGPPAALGERDYIASKKELAMAKKSPWHSIKQSVHHNDTACTEGNNIEPENKRDGTGGKPLCSHCARL
jgi:hypothetical protein